MNQGARFSISLNVTVWHKPRLHQKQWNSCINKQHSRNPQACIQSVCVANQHFMQCGVSWDLYKKHDHVLVCSALVSQKHKCDWFDNFSLCRKAQHRKIQDDSFMTGWIWSDLVQVLSVKYYIFGKGLSTCKHPL